MHTRGKADTHYYTHSNAAMGDYNHIIGCIVDSDIYLRSCICHSVLVLYAAHFLRLVFNEPGIAFGNEKEHLVITVQVIAQKKALEVMMLHTYTGQIEPFVCVVYI